MIRISLPYVYSIATAIEPLLRVDYDSRMENVIVNFWVARTNLEELLDQSVFSPSLRSSRALGHELLEKLVAVIEKEKNGEQLDPMSAVGVSATAQKFKIALLAEVGTFPSYFVAQKGGYDTLTLLDDPQQIFPPELGEKVPEAIPDISEAEKALAFELATACGFHTFRATESVLRRYYSEVTNGATQPKVRNLGVYLRLMRSKNCGDEKVLSVIEQMAKFHRNPVIHPEVRLSITEAISVIGIAHSAIDGMLGELPLAQT